MTSQLGHKLIAIVIPWTEKGLLEFLRTALGCSLSVENQPLCQSAYQGVRGAAFSIKVTFHMNSTNFVIPLHFIS